MPLKLQTTLGLLAVAACAAVLALFLPTFFPKPETHSHGSVIDNVANVDDPGVHDDITTVRTLHPKRDRTFTITVAQLATVEPYVQANLRARASGVVKYIPKDVGAPVRRGELLVEIDVPDIVQEVAQKQAIVVQRRQELRLAEAQLKSAKAHLDVAKATIDQSETLVAQARATRDLREKRWNRFKVLRTEKAINDNVVDEEERDYLSAVAAFEAARVAVRKAQADFRERETTIDAAAAEVSLRQAYIHVAERDLDRARAVADYARLTAPFDGVVVGRDIDLGTFVQNATSGASDPLISIARTDIVTIVARLPDNAAPYVTRDTDVALTFDELPGVLLEGRITRFVPSVLNSDRTMRVEIDLFNGSPKEFAAFVSDWTACTFAPLAAARPLAALTLASSARAEWGPRLKSESDPFPILPKNSGEEAAARHLLPGMSGHIRISLQKFGNSYLLPSSAVFSRGGKQFIMTVVDGTTHIQPVRVQVNDGRIAKVSLIVRSANARTGDTEVTQELTGQEEIVASRQSELAAGQQVHTATADW
jgi:multidrug resistance efflux pump